MNVVALIQARMGSTRLPGKVLLPIGDLPAIVHTYRRVRAVVENTIVVIPDIDEHGPLRKMNDDYGVTIGYIKGCPENDVLRRFYSCAQAEHADYVVRITGDCPFIEPGIVDRMVELITTKRETTYLANIWPERIYPRGLDVEVFSFNLLAAAHFRAEDPADREHVTPWMQRAFNPKTAVRLSDSGSAAAGQTDLRWCLDTPDDYTFFQMVASAMDTTPPHPTATELMDYLNAHPEVKALCRENPGSH